jgi:cytochrome c556
MRTTIRFILLSALLGASLSTALTSWAQDRKIEQFIKHRKAGFTLMSAYFSRLLQTYDGDRPFNAKQVVADAKTVEYLSRLPWEGFAPGTDHGETRAKPDIWLDEERFKKLSAELEAKTTLMTKAAETGDLKKFKISFEQTRNTCNACHKEFRKD